MLAGAGRELLCMIPLPTYTEEMREVVDGAAARQVRAERLTKAARHNNVQLIQVLNQWPVLKASWVEMDIGCYLTQVHSVLPDDPHHLGVLCTQAIEAEYPGAVGENARNIDTGDLPLTVCAC
jgi:hypothetical protein